ncbi:BgTH12-06243 [Blumeria graminis f. sp. triticale]|uniref:BgTH12-06243 n=1 Tax=Blumeria graminis f. sp. triticale TaxID=1689686 RepID=A0A9W4CXT1_BLUGR|nr:BgTH12-06243 [Blumeria graminis f. sp. triticale]
MDVFAQSREDGDLFADEYETTSYVITNPVTPTSPESSGKFNQLSLPCTPTEPQNPSVTTTSNTTPKSTKQGLSTSRYAPNPLAMEKASFASGGDLGTPAKSSSSSASRSNPTPTTTKKSSEAPPSIANATPNPPRIPAVRGDRSLTGGPSKVKLTEAELFAKLEKMRILNASKEEKHRLQEADQAAFKSQDAEIARKFREQQKKELAQRIELEKERQKNRERKMKSMGGREWDSGKDSRDEPLQDSLKHYIETISKHPVKDYREQTIKDSIVKSMEKSAKMLIKESRGQPVKEPMKEPTSQSIKEAVKQTVKEPAKQPIKEAVKQTVKEPAKQPIKEAVKQTVKEPAKQPIKEAVKQTVKEPAKQPVKEPVKQPVKKSVEVTRKQPIKETRTLIENSTKQPVKEPVKRSIIEEYNPKDFMNLRVTEYPPKIEYDGLKLDGLAESRHAIPPKPKTNSSNDGLSGSRYASQPKPRAESTSPKSYKPYRPNYRYSKAPEMPSRYGASNNSISREVTALPLSAHDFPALPSLVRNEVSQKSGSTTPTPAKVTPTPRKVSLGPPKQRQTRDWAEEMTNLEEKAMVVGATA